MSPLPGPEARASKLRAANLSRIARPPAAQRRRKCFRRRRRFDPKHPQALPTLGFPASTLGPSGAGRASSGTGRGLEPTSAAISTSSRPNACVGRFASQSARSAACTLRNPMGGTTLSISTGTRTPRRRPSSASSCTQFESIEVFDHRTITQRASLSSLPIVSRHVFPIGIVRSQKTVQPCPSSARANSSPRGRSSLA